VKNGDLHGGTVGHAKQEKWAFGRGASSGSIDFVGLLAVEEVGYIFGIRVELPN